MEGIVYVLTNVAMPDLVKIGFTKNVDFKGLKQRIQRLYTSGVPWPFDIHHAVKVANAPEAEGLLHNTFVDYQINPRREFFDVPPERVVSAMGLLLIGGGGTLVDLEDSNGDGGDESDSEIPEESRITEDVVAAQMRARVNRPPFKFARWGIPIGSILRFVRDHSKTAEVASDTEVVLDGERMRLGPAAGKLLPYTVRVAGTEYWEYEDPEHGWELLRERRKRMEREQDGGDE